MFKVTEFPHGTFSWADAQSTDVAASKQFYTGLMGWGSNDIPMGDGTFYHMLECDGESVAGLGGMPPGMESPSLWNSYVTVDDVDALAGKVSELGGTVISEPFDVFDSGRMMVLQDPSGAIVSLWQPKNHIGAGIVNKPGAMTWNEMATRDAKKAQDFFSALLGWEFQKDENLDYYYILNNGRTNGGMIPMTEEWGDMPPHWGVYFSVADIDDIVARTPELGGNVIIPIMDATVGRFAKIADPTGAVCNFIQLAEPQPWDV